MSNEKRKSGPNAGAGNSKRHPLRALLLQLAGSVLAAVAAALTHALGGVWSELLPYPILCGYAAVSGYRTVRRGLNNYLAWELPALCAYAAHRLLWTYAPPVGPTLACALVALVGAAAGEVRRREEQQSY